MNFGAKLFMGLVVLALFGAGAYTWTAVETIQPGHVGVSVKKCGGGGVAVDPIPTGYYWRSVICEEVVEYPTSLQTLILTKAPAEGSSNDDSITVTSSEGLPINVDVSLSFTLEASKVPTVYQKYRKDITHIAQAFMRQTIREALQAIFARYTAEQLYSDKREQARAEAQAQLADKLGGEGFVVVQFTLNETRVPNQVVEAINAKVAMSQEAQRAEQEVRKRKAEAEQLVAKAEGEARAKRTLADAEAYYNKTVAESLTPSYVNYKAIEKWNGALPQMTGGGALPLVQLQGVK